MYFCAFVHAHIRCTSLCYDCFSSCIIIPFVFSLSVTIMSQFNMHAASLLEKNQTKKKEHNAHRDSNSGLLRSRRTPYPLGYRSTNKLVGIFLRLYPYMDDLWGLLYWK